VETGGGGEGKPHGAEDSKKVLTREAKTFQKEGKGPWRRIQATKKLKPSKGE